MIRDYGHTVYFYGVEGSEVICDHFIQVSTQEILKQTYGDYDRSTNFYKQNPDDLAHQTFHFSGSNLNEITFTGNGNRAGRNIVVMGA